jgi:hypothetical protein
MLSLVQMDSFMILFGKRLAYFLILSSIAAIAGKLRPVRVTAFDSTLKLITGPIPKTYAVPSSSN